METLKILKYTELESTNTFAATLNQNNITEQITVIWAVNQTKGRGQRANRWESEENKNLTFSIILQPENFSVEKHFLISKTAALAIFDALSGFGIKTSIKWPNDIYFQDKKLGGILIENSLNGPYIVKSIIGAGININQTEFSENLPNPVSLKDICQKEFDIEKVLHKITKAFNNRFQQLANNQEEFISNEYFQNLYRNKGLHLYKNEDGEFLARIIEVKDSGELILEKENGERSAYFFKEVEFVI